MSCVPFRFPRVRENVIQHVTIPDSWNLEQSSLVDIQLKGGSQSGVEAQVDERSKASKVIAVKFIEAGVVEETVICHFKSQSGASSSVEFVISAYVEPEGI